MKTMIEMLLIAALLLSGITTTGMESAVPKLISLALTPYDPWDSPPHGLRKQGMPLEAWLSLFEDRARQQGIPILGSGFYRVSEVYFTEHEDLLIETDYRYTTYRAVIGGMNMFLRVFEDDTITDAYLYLDHEEPIDTALLNAQLHYFPEVMRACVYACEEGRTSEADIDRVVDMLCDDVAKAVLDGAEVSNTFLLNWPEYFFKCESDEWGKRIRFSANWLR
ncbi:hypothetical protein LJC74_00780 [Eubacteriales bacterium OttesenSCG-928-A19]|nr:hypothetical protein [Eubacteriales bacterium OttesenSCG-928-A19]